MKKPKNILKVKKPRKHKKNFEKQKKKKIFLPFQKKVLKTKNRFWTQILNFVLHCIFEKKMTKELNFYVFFIQI